jgi:hypothetical protein
VTWSRRSSSADPSECARTHRCPAVDTRTVG